MLKPNPVLDLSSRVTVLPVVHGSGDFALEVRHRLADASYDCIALPLPPSFEHAVEEAVNALPLASIVIQVEEHVDSAACSYVPIDPCQSVVAAIREAQAAGIQRAYIDLEVASFEEHALNLPDPYALKKVALERFSSAIMPFLKRPGPASQREARIARMAYELHCLELEHESIAVICDVCDWPWLRKAFLERARYEPHFAGFAMAESRPVAEESLFFLLGELPYLTYLYEHRRAESFGETSLAVDGIKNLLLEARSAWRDNPDREGTWLTPHRLSLLLKYVRNLTVMDSRLTPDLYNLALAAKQVVSDDYALAVIETARSYPPQRLPGNDDAMVLGARELFDVDGRSVTAKNRLQGIPKTWRSLPLKPTPPELERERWRLQWNPFGQCSYPPEDKKIESFQQHVREQALQLMGDFDTKTERFAASLKDGLDLRETLRNWHTGDLYVKEYPPSRGTVEIVVFLFDYPADEKRYPWHGTWYAEHEEESTLCFFATNFSDNIIGPGIGQATYGGCSFLFPPRPIPDVWTDPRLATLDPAATLEDRLIRGALTHSHERRVVLVAPQPPYRDGGRWRASSSGRSFTFR